MYCCWAGSAVSQQTSAINRNSITLCCGPAGLLNNSSPRVGIPCAALHCSPGLGSCCLGLGPYVAAVGSGCSHLFWGLKPLRLGAWWAVRERFPLLFINPSVLSPAPVPGPSGWPRGCGEAAPFFCGTLQHCEWRPPGLGSGLSTACGAAARHLLTAPAPQESIPPAPRPAEVLESARSPPPPVLVPRRCSRQGYRISTHAGHGRGDGGLGCKQATCVGEVRLELGCFHRRGGDQLGDACVALRSPGCAMCLHLHWGADGFPGSGNVGGFLGFGDPCTAPSLCRADHSVGHQQGPGRPCLGTGEPD